MTEPEISFSERVSRRSPWRIAVLVGATLAIVAGAAVTMGASPSASPGAPGATAKPQASGDPGRLRGGGPGFFGGPGFLGGPGFFGGRGGFGGSETGFGGISITAISGTNLTLATEDGWTRTIVVTSTTTIKKAGKAISASDLSVGERIRFSQTRGTDGSFTVTAIEVVLPSVAGTVTEKSATTITIERPDGSSETIHVDGNTTYEVAGATSATLGDVAVGMQLVGTGTQNADGSLDASAIHAGNRGFRGKPGDHEKPDRPGPSASPDTSSSSG